MCTSSLAGGSQQFLGEECTAGMHVPSCTLFLGWILHAAGDPAQMRPHEMCVMHRTCGTTVCCAAIEMCRCGVAVAAAAGVAVWQLQLQLQQLLQLQLHLQLMQLQLQCQLQLQLQCKMQLAAGSWQLAVVAASAASAAARVGGCCWGRCHLPAPPCPLLHGQYCWLGCCENNAPMGGKPLGQMH